MLPSGKLFPSPDWPDPGSTDADKRAAWENYQEFLDRVRRDMPPAIPFEPDQVDEGLDGLWSGDGSELGMVRGLENSMGILETWATAKETIPPSSLRTTSELVLAFDSHRAGDRLYASTDFGYGTCWIAEDTAVLLKFPRQDAYSNLLNAAFPAYVNIQAYNIFKTETSETTVLQTMQTGVLYRTWMEIDSKEQWVDHYVMTEKHESPDSTSDPSMGPYKDIRLVIVPDTGSETPKTLSAFFRNVQADLCNDVVCVYHQLQLNWEKKYKGRP